MVRRSPSIAGEPCPLLPYSSDFAKTRLPSPDNAAKPDDKILRNPTNSSFLSTIRPTESGYREPSQMNIREMTKWSSPFF